MRRVLEGDIVVLPRDHWLIDVFIGDGWEGHRVFRYENGSLKLRKGNLLTVEQYQKLCKLVNG